MNCDRIARWYRWLEYASFGRSLQQRRREYLSEVVTARRALIVGDGDGRFTAEFARAAPLAKVDSIELSANMLRLAERRVPAHDLATGRVRLLHGDARRFPLSGKYDLVVTHFFLDCFTTAELEPLLSHILQFVTADVRWLVSEFRVPPQGLPRVLGRRMIAVLYWLFGILTDLKKRRLPNYAAVFRAHGFRRQKQRLALAGILVSELWVRGG
jgi:ubiquinone/menaquinone biosynthesis C-methylase UbiE